MDTFLKASIVLLCFNQEDLIEESLNSCLQQDYSNLEIVISDDASTDNTISIIEKKLGKYQGNHKIIVNKNKSNLEIGRAHV